MELLATHAHFQRSHLASEKHQMLDLNRRLESYLGRVKFLEEENAQLAREIQALQHSGHAASVRKKSMEKELCRARVELDVAWRDRVCTEMEISKLSEELAVLDRHWQREAQAQVEAKSKLELSRKELEEEHRAQRWLRQKISQLEDEMNHLVQTHQQDVARLEATLTHSRASVPPHFAKKVNPTSDLRQLEQELCHRASRAWQEMAEAYEVQLVELEKSLNQNRVRLSQADREKSEKQAQLRALQQDIVFAQDERMHLEKSAEQQREEHEQNIHKLQEHWEGLEKEKAELGQQLNLLVLENRGLMQQKMSLSLEVATYRDLLDGEGLRRDVTLQKQPGNIAFKGASLKTFRENYRRNTTPLSSPLCPPPAAYNATTLLRSKPETISETQKELRKPNDEDTTTTTAKPENLYPKILQNGAVEEFRAQEVDEKVTYAEPLFPSGEDDEEMPPDGDVCEDDVVEEKAAVGLQLQSSLAPVSNEILPQQSSSQEQTSDLLGMTEETFSSSAECGQEETSDVPTEALAEEVYASKNVQEEKSSSETKALLQATQGSRIQEAMLQNISKEHMAEVRQEISYSTLAVNETETVDGLYPDGEEMDMWDSVMKKKIYVEPNDPKPEAKYAKPEESISVRRSEPCREVMVMQEEHISIHHGGYSQSLNNQDDEDEDSQNVSMSWRAEVEGDSYAQDNTVADTRPLIRYKSDETNTQASHMDESESSEGEQDQKTEDAVAWSESQAKNFGTMEDLCEEVEEEMVECEQGYADVENAGLEKALSEASEPILDEDERSTPVVPENVPHDEEIDTDRLVEEELENFSTDRYASHLSQQLDNNREAELAENEDEMMMIEQEHVDKLNSYMESDGQVENNADLKDLTRPLEGAAVQCEQEFADVENAGLEKAPSELSEYILDEDERSTPVVPERVPYDEEIDTDRLVEQELENLSTDRYTSHLSQQLDKTREAELAENEDGMMMMEQEHVDKLNSYMEFDSQVENNADLKDLTRPLEEEKHEEVQEDDQDAPGRREEGFHFNVSMDTHADETQEPIAFSEYLNRTEEEDEKEVELEEVEVAVEEEKEEEKEEEEEEVTEEPESVLEKLQTTSCVSEENLAEDAAYFLAAEWNVLENLSEELDITAPKDEEEPCEESIQSRPLKKEGDSVGGAIFAKEPVEISSEMALEKNAIIAVKDSAEFLKTNGKDKHDFWASSVENGAAFRADDDATENHSVMTFDGGLHWGKVVNGSSTHEQAPQKEGGLVHSEGSEAEGGCWSSGDE